MSKFPYLCFTRLLDDASREGLKCYLEDLTTVLAAWEGADVAINFRPIDPLSAWCSAPEEGLPWEIGQVVGQRTVFCRIAADDGLRVWHLTLNFSGAPCVTGALSADRFTDLLDEASDWRSYGDHLIMNAVAHTASNIEDVYSVRGFESSIYLVARFEAIFMSKGEWKGRISRKSPAEALIRAVEDTFSSDFLSRELLTIAADRKKMRKFLARCDTELLESLGAEEFSRVLAPLGLTLKQWRKAF